MINFLGYKLDRLYVTHRNSSHRPSLLSSATSQATTLGQAILPSSTASVPIASLIPRVNPSEPKKEDLSRVLYSPSDDMVRSEGRYLDVCGPVVTLEEAHKEMERRLFQFHLRFDQLHTAQLFHGSSSASLMAFTKYNNYEGELLPTGEMEEKKRVPFSGEIAEGRTGINSHALSTTWIGGIELVIQCYARPSLWSSERAQGRIDDAVQTLREEIREIQTASIYTNALKEKLSEAELDTAIRTRDFTSFAEAVKEIKGIWRAQSCFMGLKVIWALNILEINLKRVSAWALLHPEERALVSDPFPVLYGITSARKNVHFSVPSRVSGEIGLRGGAKKGEIKVIFVPSSKVAFVQDLLRRAPGNPHAAVAVEALDAFDVQSGGGPST